jgi:type IV pilus assembly protein PilY1
VPFYNTQLPTTSQVAAEQCFNTWYLYAGTGRYFFPMDNYGGSGNSGSNYIMGIPFTCDETNSQTCSTAMCSSNKCSCAAITSALNNSAGACTNLQAGDLGQAGWTYTLNAASYPFLNERMTTDPTPSTSNMVFLTTSEPTADPCGYGGRSRVWGLNCATGAALTDTSCSGYTISPNLIGNLYLQTSTGAINQVHINTNPHPNPNLPPSSFTDQSTGDRTTPWYVGMPPENAPPFVPPPATVSKTGQMIQWMEK